MTTGRRYLIGIALNLFFVVIEAGAGILSGSLALISDAGHNLTDVLGLGIAWLATVLGARSPSARRTYGSRRVTILAPLLSTSLLYVGLGVLVWEAVGRLREPGPVNAPTMMAVAGVGVLVNVGTALALARGREDDINLRGAYVHMMADAGISVGVVLAGALVAVTGWEMVDPVVGLGIAVAVVAASWRLLRDTYDLVVDAVPREIDPREVQDYLEGFPGVGDVHCLHIWAISATETALTAHLVMPSATDQDAALERLSEDLLDRFGIDHATIQIEREDGHTPCRLRRREP